MILYYDMIYWSLYYHLEPLIHESVPLFMTLSRLIIHVSRDSEQIPEWFPINENRINTSIANFIFISGEIMLNSDILNRIHPDFFHIFLVLLNIHNTFSSIFAGETHRNPSERTPSALGRPVLGCYASPLARRETFGAPWGTMRWGMFWEIAIVSKAYHGDINGEDVSPWFLMRSLFFHWNNEYHVDHRIRSPFSMNIFRQDLIRLLQRVRSWTWGSLEARTGAEVAQRFVFMISCCGRPWFVSIYIYTHILYIYIITYTWFLVCMYIYILLFEAPIGCWPTRFVVLCLS